MNATTPEKVTEPEPEMESESETGSEPEAAPESETGPEQKPGNGRGAGGSSRARTLLRFVANIGVPLALYYGLRALGVGVYVAQIVTTVIPAAIALRGLIRDRHADGLAVYMTTMLLLSLVVSLISGSVRFLLAREGWLTGVTGLWFIASIWADRPLAYHYSRPMIERITSPAGYSWEDLWERLPKFRRIWKVTSAAWGIALLADSALRVVMAYTLPVDAVPALGTALYLATSAVLIIIANVYYFIAGLFNRRSALYAPLTMPKPAGDVVAEAL
jgi:hypothetical protein